jgi:hypothetical protein
LHRHCRDRPRKGIFECVAGACASQIGSRGLGIGPNIVHYVIAENVRVQVFQFPRSSSLQAQRSITPGNMDRPIGSSGGSPCRGSKSDRRACRWHPHQNLASQAASHVDSPFCSDHISLARDQSQCWSTWSSNLDIFCLVSAGGFLDKFDPGLR